MDSRKAPSRSFWDRGFLQVRERGRTRAQDLQELQRSPEAGAKTCGVGGWTSAVICTSQVALEHSPAPAPPKLVVQCRGWRASPQQCHQGKMLQPSSDLRPSHPQGTGTRAGRPQAHVDSGWDTCS